VRGVSGLKSKFDLGRRCCVLCAWATGKGERLVLGAKGTCDDSEAEDRRPVKYAERKIGYLSSTTTRAAAASPRQTTCDCYILTRRTERSECLPRTSSSHSSFHIKTNTIQLTPRATHHPHFIDFPGNAKHDQIILENKTSLAPRPSSSFNSRLCLRVTWIPLLSLQGLSGARGDAE
jgi:hypothetical protein